MKTRGLHSLRERFLLCDDDDKLFLRGILLFLLMMMKGLQCLALGLVLLLRLLKVGLLLVRLLLLAVRLLLNLFLLLCSPHAPPPLPLLGLGLQLLV